MVTEIYCKPWDFTLYQVNNDLVISVVFFGLVDYHRSFRIETGTVDTSNYESLGILSEKIRRAPDEYSESEVKPAIFF
ncbi:MAG: hypothetical protein MUC87_06510 [Bacteroidia bacterium]|jgi:hypothetical protein|nr:hypothetical protein [Bacteroidia bacterium]